MDATASGVEVETVEYSLDPRSVHSQNDQENPPASKAVIATLADVLDTEPVALDPLHATVDPDAVDALALGPPGRNGDTQVAFMHEGHSITAHSDSGVTITPEDELTAKKHGRGREDDF